MSTEIVENRANTPANPPGPRNLHPFSQVRPLGRDRLGFLKSLADTYGDVSMFKLANINVYLVNDPAAIEAILLTDHKKFKKTPGYEFMGRLLGRGILTADGDFHRRNRRMIQPAFYKSRINHYGDTMVRYILEAEERWEDDKQIDMAGEMMHLTLNIIAKTLFDTDAAEDAELVSETLDSFYAIMHRFENPFARMLDYLPVPSTTRFERNREAMDEMLYRKIQEHRAGTADRRDVLSMMIQARDEAGDPMSLEQLRDEVITLFMAGHETTALMTAWTWMLLAQHPWAAEKVHAELDAVIGGRTPTAGDMANLPYLRKVLSESMRLYPPAYVIDREPLEDYPVGGYTLRKGGYVLLSQWCMHRHPAYWPDPDRFDPERFAPEAVAKRPKFSYFPFGGGPRICIGEGFAWLEGMLVFATLAQRWAPELPEGFAPKCEPLVTLRPKGGMPMTLRRR